MFTDLCKTCRVPLFLSQVGRWEDNGVIHCAFLPGGRGIFYEPEGINSLVQGIEDLIGLPIEHILIESVRRDAQEFMEGFLRAQISEAQTLPSQKEMAKSARYDESSKKELLEKRKEYNIAAITVGRIFGYGDVQLGEGWENGERYPWRTQIIRNPYSILSYTAEAIGTVEAFEKRDMWGKYKEIGEDTYRISVYPGKHPIGLEHRLLVKSYPLKPGDIVYERCPECRAPLEISSYRWVLEEGMIIDSDSGRRMALIPPASVEAILADLEAELGEEVPEAVIEAQRQTVKRRLGGESWNRSGWTFKHLLGLRGLGNLTRFEAGEHGLSLAIENFCMPLLLVGLVKGLAEIAYKVDKSTHEWSFSESGDLNILIKT